MSILEYNLDNFNFLVTENRKMWESQEHLKSELAAMSHTLEQFKRLLFGPKSERIVETSGETPDFPDLELPEPAKKAEGEITVPEHKRKHSDENKGKFTMNIPENLPVEIITIDIPESKKVDPVTGEKLVVIGYDESEKLAYRPGGYFRKIIRRPKHGKKNDPLFGIIQALVPPSILEGSKFDPSFLAHIVTEKYAYHMPLNRQLEKLANLDIIITAQQMSSLIINLGNKVMPLVHLIEQKLFEQGVIFTDDTPVKLRQKGRRNCKQGYMWIYLNAKPNAPPYHIYKFTNGRSHKFSKEHLKNFNGYIHADAFPAYEDLDTCPDSGISWSACWAHARRKFFELGESSEIGQNVVKQMQRIFAYEKIVWRTDVDDVLRLKIRQKRERSLVNKLFDYLKGLIRHSAILPKSNIAKAIAYMLKRENNFRIYLSNPDLRIENNASERALRKVVLGRNNWLYVGSERGGHAAAALLSLVQTCRAMKIDPQEYLEDIFTRLLDHPAKKLEELLPDQWIQLREK